MVYVPCSAVIGAWYMCHAALVFDVSKETSPTHNGSEFPTHVSYKIRMDTDRVDSTSRFKVVDRSVIAPLTHYPTWH